MALTRYVSDSNIDAATQRLKPSTGRPHDALLNVTQRTDRRQLGGFGPTDCIEFIRMRHRLTPVRPENFDGRTSLSQIVRQGCHAADARNDEPTLGSISVDGGCDCAQMVLDGQPLDGHVVYHGLDGQWVLCWQIADPSSNRLFNDEAETRAARSMRWVDELTLQEEKPDNRETVDRDSWKPVPP